MRKLWFMSVVLAGALLLGGCQGKEAPEKAAAKKAVAGKEAPEKAAAAEKAAAEKAAAEKAAAVEKAAAEKAAAEKAAAEKAAAEKAAAVEKAAAEKAAAEKAAAEKAAAEKAAEKTAAEKAAEEKAGIQLVSSKHAKVSFARSETTVAQYRACVEAGECEFKHHETKSDHRYCNWGYGDRDDHPMNCVDWYGADQFCRWAGGRLPTEQEWETEAGAGGSREYPWGSEEPSCSRCVMGDIGKGCGKDRTWPVCSKRQGDSVSGLCDMAGNVWEWTSSWYDSEEKGRVLRGSSWRDEYPSVFRASLRNLNSPDDKAYSYGFRCVVLSR